MAAPQESFNRIAQAGMDSAAAIARISVDNAQRVIALQLALARGWVDTFSSAARQAAALADAGTKRGTTKRRAQK
jgi:hypothetical protein